MGATLVDDIYAGALGVARAVEIDVWFHAMAQKPAVCQPGLVWPGLAWPGLLCSTATCKLIGGWT